MKAEEKVTCPPLFVCSKYMSFRDELLLCELKAVRLQSFSRAFAMMMAWHLERDVFLIENCSKFKTVDLK